MIKKENNYFILNTANTSYIMRVLDINILENVYYGKRLENLLGIEYLSRPFDINIGNVPYYDESHQRHFNARIMYEYPTEGAGDSSEAAISLTYLEGESTLSLSYAGYRIYKGKDNSFIAHALSDSETETLEIKLKDESLSIYITLFYTVYEKEDIILRSAKIENEEEFPIYINRAASLSLDLNGDDYTLSSFDGAWARERKESERPLLPGIVKIDSKTGTSSNIHNPLIFIKRKHSCYGFNLIYSSNHAEIIDVSPFKRTRVVTGINDYQFEWKLEKGDGFSTPEAIMTYASSESLAAINFHKFVNKYILRGTWKDKERPILINSWEASYFNYTEESLLELAKSASDLGFELFVLDDGWFASRRDDTKALGDWHVCRKIFKEGLLSFSKKLKDLNLSFGLWVEPEMVNEDSDLYRSHPDWLIRVPGRRAAICRHQYVLDLSRKEVEDYLYERLEKVFSESGVSYVKWDFNRTITDYYTTGEKKALMHRYVLGLYSLMDRLIKRFPDILFEGCAAGGNRYDLGMLCYVSQIWTSDNTDLYHRLDIEEGTLKGYPLSTMASHVSASPAHQSLRISQIDSRFSVASFGLLGYELDLNKLSREDKEAVKRQIEFYKRYRKVFQMGTFYILESGEYNRFWSVKYEKTAIVLEFVYRNMPNTGYSDKLVIPFLDENKSYRIREREHYIAPSCFGTLYDDYKKVEKKAFDIIVSGEILKKGGIFLPPQFAGNGFFPTTRVIGDNGARLYIVEEV